MISTADFTDFFNPNNQETRYKVQGKTEDQVPNRRVAYALRFDAAGIEMLKSLTSDFTHRPPCRKSNSQRIRN
jgi:hypothetical protein